MGDLFHLTGTPVENTVVLEALAAYQRHAQKRYDPTFVPKPGKRDRNREIMRLTEDMIQRVEQTSVLDLRVDPDERRVLRNALSTYGTRPNDVVPIEVMNAAKDIVERVPPNDDAAPSADRPEPEATVKRVADYHVR